MRWLLPILLAISCGRAPEEGDGVRERPTREPPAAPKPVSPSGPSSPPPAPAPVTEVAGVKPVEGDHVIRDFTFTGGETMAELRIHYMTLGALQRDARGRARNAVLIMHGTTGSGRQFLRKQFADELFGPGQPLDLRRYS